MESDAQANPKQELVKIETYLAFVVGGVFLAPLVLLLTAPIFYFIAVFLEALSGVPLVGEGGAFGHVWAEMTRDVSSRMSCQFDLEGVGSPSSFLVIPNALAILAVYVPGAAAPGYFAGRDFTATRLLLGYVLSMPALMVFVLFLPADCYAVGGLFWNQSGQFLSGTDLLPTLGSHTLFFGISYYFGWRHRS